MQRCQRGGASRKGGIRVDRPTLTYLHLPNFGYLFVNIQWKKTEQGNLLVGSRHLDISCPEKGIESGQIFKWEHWIQFWKEYSKTLKDWLAQSQITQNCIIAMIVNVKAKWGQRGSKRKEQEGRRRSFQILKISWRREIEEGAKEKQAVDENRKRGKSEATEGLQGG